MLLDLFGGFRSARAFVKDTHAAELLITLFQKVFGGKSMQFAQVPK